MIATSISVHLVVSITLATSLAWIRARIPEQTSWEVAGKDWKYA